MTCKSSPSTSIVQVEPINVNDKGAARARCATSKHPSTLAMDPNIAGRVGSTGSALIALHKTSLEPTFWAKSDQEKVGPQLGTFWACWNAASKRWNFQEISKTWNENAMLHCKRIFGNSCYVNTLAGQKLCLLSRPTAKPFPPRILLSTWFWSISTPEKLFSLLNLKRGDNWPCHTCHAKWTW